MSTPAATPLPILWSAFVPTHLMFLIIGNFVPAEPIAQADLVPLLALPAVVAAGIAAEGSLLARVAPKAQSWFVMRFALAEVAALVGFLSYFLTGTHLVQFLCAGVGFMAHVLSLPTAGALTRHAALQQR
ncbi:MAG: hypothetical protein Q8P41_01120 [Pseudomonadota bacterium]|nr:hypothetical protein [Pseudomonadota bacterium]